MQIIQVTQFDENLQAAVNALLPQLSETAEALDAYGLEEIIASDTTHLLVAVDGGRICGMLTLVLFRIPTGVRGWIEDVVVNKADRGKGIGHALLAAAIEMARSKGAKTLDLTSRPAREAANQLYRRIGFEIRDTNAYRLIL